VQGTWICTVGGGVESARGGARVRRALGGLRSRRGGGRTWNDTVLALVSGRWVSPSTLPPVYTAISAGAVIATVQGHRASQPDSVGSHAPAGMPYGRGAPRTTAAAGLASVSPRLGLP